MVKALVLLILAASIFGGAAYFTYELLIKPDQELRADRARGPEPPPPDPSIPEFNVCAGIQKKGDLLAARNAFEAFITNYPQSTKLDAARDALGKINTDLFFTQAPAPEKEVYVVKSGDVLNRVAMRTKTNPELIMRQNNLSGIMLRIGQKLTVTPVDFSIAIHPRRQKVTLYNGKRFFKQYPILVMPGGVAAKTAKPGPPPVKQTGKVVDKIATDPDGNRVIFTDKSYALATHKVSISISGHSLYSVVPADPNRKMTAPQTGLGLAAGDVAEIAVLISKNDPVTIE